MAGLPGGGQVAALQRPRQRLVALDHRLDAVGRQACGRVGQGVQQVVVVVAVELGVAHCGSSVHRPPEGVHLHQRACQLWRRVAAVQHLAHLRAWVGGRWMRTDERRPCPAACRLPLQQRTPPPPMEPPRRTQWLKPSSGDVPRTQRMAVRPSLRVTFLPSLPTLSMYISMSGGSAAGWAAGVEACQAWPNAAAPAPPTRSAHPAPATQRRPPMAPPTANGLAVDELQGGGHHALHAGSEERDGLRLRRVDRRRVLVVHRLQPRPQHLGWRHSATAVALEARHQELRAGRPAGWAGG